MIFGGGVVLPSSLFTFRPLMFVVMFRDGVDVRPSRGLGIRTMEGCMSVLLEPSPPAVHANSHEARLYS